jgi:hypothetical protein
MPPRAFPPFTVSKSRSVSNSQSRFPPTLLNAHGRPSMDPEKTAPGMTVTGAIWAVLQAGLPRHGGLGGAAYQIFSPV